MKPDSESGRRSCTRLHKNSFTHAPLGVSHPAKGSGHTRISTQSYPQCDPRLPVVLHVRRISAPGSCRFTFSRSNRDPIRPGDLKNIFVKMNVSWNLLYLTIGAPIANTQRAFSTSSKVMDGMIKPRFHKYGAHMVRLSLDRANRIYIFSVLQSCQMFFPGDYCCGLFKKGTLQDRYAGKQPGSVLTILIGQKHPVL